ncbi:hypothetical protein [Pseudomonas putida]|uniref:Uncharacterized protein n=1 Tax=Pseudomonas putida TaxID=303 RepID=A0A177SQB1_PSEPU|nr:hypothetical protein AYO28_15185 [Pseudomonas putida]
MSTMQESARQCAGLFRLGRDIEAAVAMVELFAAAPALFALAPGATQEAFAALFSEMLAAQQRQDWISLADSLEYELPNLIEQAAPR